MTLVFDFDGTLVDIAGKYYQVYCQFLAEHGGVAKSQSAFWKDKRRGRDNAQLAQSAGVTAERAAGFTRYIEEHIELEESLRLDRLFPAVREVLQELSAQHTCILLTKRRNAARFEDQVDSLGIRCYFRQVLVADSNQSSPRLPVKAAELNYLEICRCGLIVGDSDQEVIAGRYVGLRTCAITTGIRDADYLQSQQPDFIIDSLQELPPIVQQINPTKQTVYEHPIC